MPHDFRVQFEGDFDEDNVVGAEWTTRDGERVRGVLKLVGWRRPPSSGVADVINRQKRTPRVTVRPAHAGPKG